jgi:hypothetical protein
MKTGIGDWPERSRKLSAAARARGHGRPGGFRAVVPAHEWAPFRGRAGIQRDRAAARHKYRRKVFDANALGWLQEHLAHVSVSVLVSALKGTSSRLLRAQRPDLSARY